MLLALAAALLTFAILFAGALATTAASLPTPVDVIYYSSLHTQAGEYLGAAAIGLLAWIAATRPQVRILAGALAATVALEGLLSMMQQPFLHACLAQAVCAGAITLVASSSPSNVQIIQDYGWPSLRSLSILLPALISIQVGLGAAFRHGMLGLMPHVIGAMLVSLFILIVGSFVLQQCKDHKALAGAGRALMVTTFVQVFLGLAVFTARSMPTQETEAILVTAAAHVATGAALLGVSVVLGMQIRRNVVPKS